MTVRDVGSHVLRRRFETVRAGFSRHIVLMLLIGFAQRSLAGKALRRTRFLQAGIHAHSLIEHEALPLVVLATALLEVLENAAIELQDGLEPLALHEGSCLLAADATGAEHHDGLLFQLGREPGDRAGKLTEMIYADGERICEGPELHFVIVTRIQQRHRAPLIQPALELPGGELRRGSSCWIDTGDTESNDLLLQADQHAPEGLMGGRAAL